MTTGNTQPLAAHAPIQPFTPNPPHAHPVSHDPAHAAAPPTAPTKRDLASWWKNFKRKTKEDDNKARQNGGIFGVALNVSIKYANVAISLTNDKGESFIYGYVPIVVAKCGVFLKDQATEVEGIFRLSGSARRIKELQEIFDSPERYGKGLDWAGYTVHDAANILRRYLNQLPEPIVPLDFYESFREPLRNHQAQAVGSTEAKDADTGDFNYEQAVTKYQQLIRELPPLNKQLLLYILDLLAVFASKSEKNRMTSANLSAIFQPGLLSHPSHDMAPNEYRLSQDVLIFLIENQDHFLFGMNGTAADPQTVKDIQSSAAAAAATPSRSPGVRRSASNASGGADSLRKYETLRRNVSVSSRNSGTTQSPGTPTSTVSTVKRSNTVPSKKSPALVAPRLGRSGESPNAAAASLTPSTEAKRTIIPEPRSPAALQNAPQEAVKPATQPQPASDTAIKPTDIKIEGPQYLDAQPTPTTPSPGALTPTKERKLSSFFSKSPPPVASDQKEIRQPNRLKKKRIPGSANASAQSSSHSLSAPASHEPLFPQSGLQVATPVAPTSDVISTIAEDRAVSKVVPDGSTSHHQHQPSESTLKVSRSRTPSMHSKSSYTDHSDFDQYDDATKSEKRDNRRSWRFPLSRHNHDYSSTSPPPVVGLNSRAEFSNSSIGSSFAQRQSSNNDSHPPSTDVTSVPDNEAGRVARDGGISSDNEKRSLFEKLKAKVAPKKEGSEHSKSPPLQSDPAPVHSQLEEKEKEIQREQEPQIEPQQQDQPQPAQPPAQATEAAQPETSTSAPTTADAK